MSEVNVEPVMVTTAPPYAALKKNDALPTVLTIAGSDSSGGAGIEADLKTITSHRCYGLTCITALTAQTPERVYAVHNTPKSHLKLILQSNLRDMRVDVIKTGMLTDDAVDVLIEVLGAIPKEQRPSLVVDPVLIATSGFSLAEGNSTVLKIKELAPLATLLTPNIYECAQLLGREFTCNDVNDLIKAGEELRAITKCPNVLVKGGHAPWIGKNGGKYVTDVLCSEDGHTIYQSEFCAVDNTHGTGCTLASAISSNLAHKESLGHAIYGAIQYVHNAIQIGCQVTLKHVKENGPINHVYAIKMPLKEMIEDVCYSAHNLSLEEDDRASNCSSSSVISQIRDSGSFFQYLISDSRVKPYWEAYINHDFVRQVADGTLPREKFRFFLEQDYAYLDNYAQIHCTAASKAPTDADFRKSIEVVSSIKLEMEKHREKMMKHFGISDMKHFDEIKKSPALKNYARFFLDVAKSGSWEHLCVALSPCLMGYGNALLIRQNDITVPEDDIYHTWCKDYLSPWYTDAMDEGLILLDRICQMTSDWDALCEIYAAVCKLEKEFWDSALAYHESKSVDNASA